MTHPRQAACSEACREARKKAQKRRDNAKASLKRVAELERELDLIRVELEHTQLELASARLALKAGEEVSGSIGGSSGRTVALLEKENAELRARLTLCGVAM